VLHAANIASWAICGQALGSVPLLVSWSFGGY